MTLYRDKTLRSAVLTVRIERLENGRYLVETDWAGSYANLIDPGRRGRGVRVKTTRDLTDYFRGKRATPPALGYWPVHRRPDERSLSIQFAKQHFLLPQDYPSDRVYAALFRAGKRELLGFWPSKKDAKRSPPLAIIGFNQIKDNYEEILVSNLEAAGTEALDGGIRDALSTQSPTAHHEAPPLRNPAPTYP